ncbi:SLIT and NTRK-like protein 2 [Branchiostoma floridae]|uniref:SLIT and NTRK-like protein 2 n=1 Tax=Branchiostoma floridae TaxID=7739 RepID=C3ZQ61_BRAFL|nr:SLIT and NTRK-like protein 2 [Branchiostoma floridae]|eukprot:XP_002589429.1 hypothetical protein BRAFLDRAFT_80174 [Branchiostoma floridae]
MKSMLVFLLIILNEARPTAACSSSCPLNCHCENRGLSSVPQDLPTSIGTLWLYNNVITTLSQSDFSRYSRLLGLHSSNNQISVINPRAFYNLTRLRQLSLEFNRLTSLRADMFVGLVNLMHLFLLYNNIHSIEASTFNATQQLRLLDLRDNHLTTFATSVFVNLTQLSTLLLSGNSMETLPVMAYDILASTQTVDISNNPWQCDCRMLPFKQRMTGSYAFESQIICAGPANLTGKSLLHDVNTDDLFCEETTTTSVVLLEATTVSSGSYFHPVFLIGFISAAIGLLTSAIFLAIWCVKKRVKTRPAPVADLSDVHSNINNAPTRGHYHAWQGASTARSGTVPLPHSFDQSSSVLRPPLPPIMIKAAAPHQDYQQDVQADVHGADALKNYVPLNRHFIYQQTRESRLPKGLAAP